MEQRLALADSTGNQGFNTLSAVTTNSPAPASIFTATQFTIQLRAPANQGTGYFEPISTTVNFGAVTFDTTSNSGLFFSDAVWGTFQSTYVAEDAPGATNRAFYVAGNYTGGTGAGPTTPNPARASMAILFTQSSGPGTPITFQATMSIPETRPPVEPDPIIVSSDIGCTSEPRVYVIDPVTGTVINSFLAYEAGFRGGVRVAIGDVDGDPTTLEIVTAPGPGRSGQVRVFPLNATGPTDRITSFDYTPFGAGYRGGVELAVGNLNGLGRDELIVSASQGAGLVKTAASSGTAFTTDKAFTAFAAPYKNGATVAIGGINQVLVANGSTKQPLVKTYDVSGAPTSIGSFAPRPPSGTGGVSLSTQNFVAGSVQSVVAGGAGAGSATGVFQNQSNPAIRNYSPFATAKRPNAATFAAAAKINSDIATAVIMSQGSAGLAPLVRLDATTGVVDPSFNPTYNGNRLSGPLRVATRGPSLQLP